MSARRRTFDWSTIFIASLVIGSAATVYWRHGPERVVAIFLEDVVLLGDILPKVLAGCLIGAFVTLMLPRETVSRWVGAESGVSGLVIATLVGAIMPGGPFTIYPLGAAFLTVGADVGAVVAFVTSWTLIGYNRAIVWEMPFFGLDFVLWRILFSLPLPLIAGLLARWAIGWFAADERAP